MCVSYQLVNTLYNIMVALFSDIYILNEHLRYLIILWLALAGLKLSLSHIG